MKNTQMMPLILMYWQSWSFSMRLGVSQMQGTMTASATARNAITRETMNQTLTLLVAPSGWAA